MTRILSKIIDRVSILGTKFIQLDLFFHISCALACRFILIAYGVYHDQVSEVPYTDIDYKVFTDASRHILNRSSPYDRHTYRYSPLIALLLIPNITVHPVFGKILFCTFDLFVALLIRSLVKYSYISWVYFERSKSQKKRKSKKRIAEEVEGCVWAHRAMLFWLYNPMTLAISTRGNSDSIACFLVLLTLSYVQIEKRYFLAGLIHGLSIHFRLYPIIYSLTFYMHLSKFSYYDKELSLSGGKAITNVPKSKKLKNDIVKSNSENGVVPYLKPKEKKTIFKKKYLLYLVPNFDQVSLVAGTLLSLTNLTLVFYYLYGDKFLHESLIYHFVRTDTRHNFSLYFYYLYLTAYIKNLGIWNSLLPVVPQILLLLVFSFRYGLNKFSLNFAILLQTVVFVVYNKVLTSQYFVWILGVLPLCFWQINLTRSSVFVFTCIWFLAQAGWLMTAYFLEFLGENTFLYIWLQGVSLFCAHIVILGRLVKHFSLPSSDKKSA